jgi:asparagine synthase (glutamine-hydrolysing)
MIHAMPPDRIDDAFRKLRPLLPTSFHHGALADKAHKLADLLSLDSPQNLYYCALSHWEKPSDMVLGSCELSTIRAYIDDLPSRLNIEEVMMLTDLDNYLPDDILTKLDRASMAVSLEARVPLLDHRIVEFAWKLPLRVKIRNREKKWILRQVLHKYIPAEMMDRPKQGFGVPINRWLRGPLREWAESLLDEDRLRSEGYLDPGLVREVWNANQAGRGAWHFRLWDILMFEGWLKENQGKRTANRLAPAAKCAYGL